MHAETLSQAIDAFNSRRFYEVHEILEPLWRRLPATQKPFYQGLIQVACAFYKAERGELRPALTLFRRGLAQLAPFATTEPLTRFWYEVLRASEELRREGIAAFDPVRIPRLPLCPASLEAPIPRLYNTSGGKTMLITRRFRFSAAHRYYDESLSPEENQQLFGKCAGAHGHGHNYVLDVTVRGPIDPKTGMIVNLKDLKAAVEQRVIERYDFKHLNFDTEDFKGTQPTCEQIVVTVWKLLDGQIPGCELARLRLYESDELFVEYEGR